MFNFLIKNRIKKVLKNTSRKKVFHSWEEIKSILVLFDTQDYEDADIFIEYLKKKGKIVTVYAFKNKKDLYDYSETPYVILTPKEIRDWTGESLEEAITPLKKEEYDLVIDLTLKSHPVLEYVLVSSNANLKVGYKKSNLPLYDMTIASLPETSDTQSQPIRDLAKQIVYYLSTISSK